MDTSTFEVILNDRLQKIKSVLGNKAKEYAIGGDRLYNFKVAARINGSTPEQALWGMATKHLICVMDMVNGDLKTDKAMIDEKIGDMINYLILLEAVLLENVETKKPIEYYKKVHK